MVVFQKADRLVGEQLRIVVAAVVLCRGFVVVQVQPGVCKSSLSSRDRVQPNLYVGLGQLYAGDLKSGRESFIVYP